MYTSEQARFLADVFVGILERESEITRRVLAAYPEAHLDFKLGEKGRTGRDLLWHMASGDAWFGEAVCRGDFNQQPEEEPVPETLAGMLEWYDRKVPPIIAKVKALEPEHLARPVDFFGMLTMPLVYFLNFWAVHTIHHRGQLSIYIRALNAHVPDIYGGSADEPLQMPAGT